VTKAHPVDAENCHIISLFVAMKSSRATSLVNMQSVPKVSETVSVSETLDTYCKLTRLIALEEFITKHSVLESFKPRLLFAHLKACLL
jgi:hypothetical protein